MKDVIETVFWSPAVIIAACAAGLISIGWIVRDYNIQSEQIEAKVREACIQAGGSGVRVYGGQFQCILPREHTAQK